MGDTKNWHLEVSVDVHSVQFVDGGQYVLVLTFDKDHRMGVHDLQISRDGATFIDGHCLMSDILQQDEPEKTVETPNNLFVFRLPKGFAEDDDYSKLTLHLESYLLDTETQSADIGGAGDKGDDDQLKMSGLVYRKLGAGVIPLGKVDSDTTGNHSTNVIPVKGISSDKDVAGTIGSVKYTVNVQPMDSATAEKQHDPDDPVKAPDTATPGYDIDSPFTQYSATPEESAAASAASSLRNMTFNNSTIVQKPISCLARQGYLTDGLPLEYETLRMGVGGLACTVLTCVLPAFASNSLNKAKQRYHVTMADIYDVSSKDPDTTQMTGSWIDVAEPEVEACKVDPSQSPVLYQILDDNLPAKPEHRPGMPEVIPAMPEVIPAMPEFVPAKPDLRPNLEDTKNYPAHGPPHAVEVLYEHQQQALETCRRSVDVMTRDVSSLQSRLSELQNENAELKQTLSICTCSSNQQVSVSTTNIIRDDISIAHGTATNVTIGGSLETHHTATQPPSLPGYGATLVGNAMKRPSPVNMPIYGSGAGVSTGGIDGVKQPNSTSYPGGHWAGNDDGTPMWMQLRKPVAIEATAPAESTTSILETLSGIDVAKAPKPTSSTGVNVGQIDNVQSLSVLRPTTKEESNIYDSLGPSSAQISDGNAGGFDIVQKPHGTTTSWALPKPSNGTDVNLDEICKEYADMMDVRKLLPKGAQPWSPSCDHPLLDVEYATPLQKLQALQDMYKQQLAVVKRLRKKQNQKQIEAERENGGTSSSASDVSINITGQQVASNIPINEQTKIKILAKLDFLQTRITSLETELAKNTKTWEDDKGKMEAKLKLKQVAKTEPRPIDFELPPRINPFFTTEGDFKPADGPLAPLRPPHTPYPGQTKHILPRPPSRPSERSRPSPKSSAGRMFVQLYPVLSGYLSNSSSGTRVGKSPRPPKSPRLQKSPRVPRSPKSPHSRRDRRETAYLRPVSNVPRLPTCCDASNLLPRPNPSRTGKVTIVPENPPKPGVNLPRPSRKQQPAQQLPNPRTTWRY